MSLFYSEVRRPFRFLSPMIWAILLDATDFLASLVLLVVRTIIFFFGLTGVPLFIFGVAILTFVQVVLALIIFADPLFALSNLDIVAGFIPGGKLFPSYTAKIFAHQKGLVK